MALPAAATGPAIFYSTSFVGLKATQSHQWSTLAPVPQVEKHACSVQSLLAVQFIVQSSSNCVFLSMLYQTPLKNLFKCVFASKVTVKTISCPTDTEPQNFHFPCFAQKCLVVKTLVMRLGLIKTI